MELNKEVYINGKLSNLATEKLLSFTIEDNIGLQLDSLEISLNNAEDIIESPNTKFILEIAIGDKNNNLYKMGKFVAQNVETTTSIISIEAISQDLTLSKIKHNRVFKNITLEEILNTLAKDLNVTPQIDPKLKSTNIEYYLQENKGSLEVLVELSEIFYAISNIKDNNLVFISKDNTKIIEIDEENILNISKYNIDNTYYNGVICSSWNIKEGKQITQKLGKEPYLLLNSSVTQSLQKTYLNSKYKEIGESEYINITLKQGNLHVQSGFVFKLNNHHSYSHFNGKYRIEKVIHSYNNIYMTNILAVKINQ